jgi:predicted kinase
VIADGVFGDPAKRARIERAAAAAGVPFAGFWLETQEAVLEARVGGRRGDASDADVAIVRAQAAMQTGRIDWVSIDAGGSIEATAERVRGALAQSAQG